MILVDAAPLISLFDSDDEDHEFCLLVLQELPLPLHTTWPTIAEAMYMLHKYVGWRGQRSLWQMIRNRELIIVDLDQTTVERASELMEKYSDVPMDVADATLCALAEHLNCKKIFTLDGDFKIYKFRNRAAFHVVPA
jgi:predicted nucleic acid-binding protein